MPPHLSSLLFSLLLIDAWSTNLQEFSIDLILFLLSCSRFCKCKEVILLDKWRRVPAVWGFPDRGHRAGRQDVSQQKQITNRELLQEAESKQTILISRSCHLEKQIWSSCEESTCWGDRCRRTIEWVSLPFIFTIWHFTNITPLQHAYLFDHNSRCRSGTTTLRSTRRCPLPISLLLCCLPWSVPRSFIKTHLPSRRRARDLLIGPRILVQRRLLSSSGTQQEKECLGIGDRRGWKREYSLSSRCRWRVVEGHCCILHSREVWFGWVEEASIAKTRST